MLPYVYQVTKYDPADRDDYGHYVGTEPATSDHGPVEAAYLQAVAAFVEDTGVDQLAIREPQLGALLERVRAEQPTDEWKDRYAARAGIEGTIHQAVAVSGMRRTRYRGRAKTHLGHVLTAAAANLIRLDACRCRIWC